MNEERKRLYDEVVKQFLYLREHMVKKIKEDPEYENTEEYAIAGKTLLGIHETLEELKADLTND